MVVVDTDVVSALMHSDPNAEVLAWLDSRPTRVFFVTAVIEAEVRAGIAFLPEGARRRGLAEAAERAFSGLFAGRCCRSTARRRAPTRRSRQPAERAGVRCPWPTARSR